MNSCFVYLSHMKQLFSFILFSTYVISAIAQSRVVIKSDKEEKWWGGAVAQAHLAPYGNADFTSNLNYDNKGNQAQPLLISNKGRVIWSENPFSFTFRGDSLIIADNTSPVIEEKQGSTLRDAYLFASKHYFP